jgi:ferric-dicitrate binding protein FerR (iron transport regulator)
MSRLAARWMRATDVSLPPLDLEKGIERLLRAEPTLALRRRTRCRLWFGTALLMVIALVVLVQAFRPQLFQAGPRSTPGIRLSESIADQDLRFPDGSRITVLAGTGLAVGEVGERGARLSIDRGHVNVEITRGADANWTIEAGPFVVKATGTAFDLKWLPEERHFALSVDRGTVSVNGPMLGEGRSIIAGTRCTVDCADDRIVVERVAFPENARHDAAGAVEKSIPQHGRPRPGI